MSSFGDEMSSSFAGKPMLLLSKLAHSYLRSMQFLISLALFRMNAAASAKAI
jgi:hypothetical protein